MTPAVADAIPLDRVQGIESDIGDLILHDGRNLAQEIGGGITASPTLTRSVESSSSLEIQVYDPDLSFLRTSLLAEKFDAKIDGLWFRYLGVSKSGRNLTLRFEDRDVAILRESEGPKKAFRAKVTRAEFVKTLVEEGNPRLKFICPQLHVKQPVKKKAQVKKANADAKEQRGPGLGGVKHLTVDGAGATRAQLDLGETAIRIADSLKAPFRVQVSLMAALMTESGMGSSAPGNVLQALGPGGAPIGPAEDEISGYLTNEPEWTGEGAIAYARRNPDASFSEIAQATQASAFSDGSNYAKFADEARAWVEAFSGEVGESGSETVTEPYTFEVGKKETYWAAIQRLAKEVNWRAFVVAGRFYFMPEPELYAGMVRLAIEAPSEKKPEGTPGIEDVDFDFNVNKKVTEVTVSARVKQWKPPPGSVVTLAGYGPASIGFGDAPVKANKKGQKQGISSNRNARTGEGRGRYIVSSIQVPIADNPESRLGSMTLRKPTAKLPEPQAETKTVSGAPSDTALGSGASAEALAEVSITNATPGSPYWGGAAAVFKQFVHPFMEQHGLSPGGEKEQGHASTGDHDPEGQPSGYATDYPTTNGEATARALAVAMGNGNWSANSYDSFTVEVDGYRFDVQILWGASIDHADHVHVGMHRV